MLMKRPILLAYVLGTSLFCIPLSGMAQEQKNDFKLGDSGITGSWDTQLTAGTAIRTRDPRNVLIGKSFNNKGRPKGGTGSDAVDGGDYNFKKGDPVSSPVRLFSDVDLKYGDYGIHLSGRAWYDYTLEHESVRAGNIPNGYREASLSDRGFYRGNRFSGAQLLDAYLYAKWNIGTADLKVELGKQTLHWGNSLFFLGVDRINPLDLTALHRPGTDPQQEARVPVPMLHFNLGFENGFSMEGFYQFQWRRAQIDPCGTFFSGVDAGPDTSCSTITTNGLYPLAAAELPASAATWYNSHFSLMNGLELIRQPDRNPRNGGEWGMALHRSFDALHGELGLYYENIHSSLPIVGVANWNAAAITTPDPALLAAGAPPAIAQLGNGLKTLGYGWQYPGNIKVMGLSYSAVLNGWAMAWELTHVKGEPGQLNVPDLLNSVVASTGPLYPRVADKPPGYYIKGYDRLNKTQFQFNVKHAFQGILGADGGSFAGEVMVSHVDNLPPLSTARYLRGYPFGFSTAGYGGEAACSAATDPLQGFASGCKNDGFATRWSWGYRMRGELDYSTGIAGLTLAPSLMWFQDVKGNSIDNQLLDKRKMVTLGLRADYKKKYFGEFSYNSWLGGATFDSTGDRDYVSLVVGMNF